MIFDILPQIYVKNTIKFEKNLDKCQKVTTPQNCPHPIKCEKIIILQCCQCPTVVRTPMLLMLHWIH